MPIVSTSESTWNDVVIEHTVLPARDACGVVHYGSTLQCGCLRHAARSTQYVQTHRAILFSLIPFLRWLVQSAIHRRAPLLVDRAQSGPTRPRQTEGGVDR